MSDSKPFETMSLNGPEWTIQDYEYHYAKAKLRISHLEQLVAVLQAENNDLAHSLPAAPRRDVAVMELLTVASSDAVWDMVADKISRALQRRSDRLSEKAMREL